MSRTPERADQARNMVLRTVYLPIEMDEALKNAAMLIGCSKNDLIRGFVGKGLAEGTRAADVLARERGRTINPVEVEPLVPFFEASTVEVSPTPAEDVVRFVHPRVNLWDGFGDIETVTLGFGRSPAPAPTARKTLRLAGLTGAHPTAIAAGTAVAAVAAAAVVRSKRNAAVKSDRKSKRAASGKGPRSGKGVQA